MGLKKYEIIKVGSDKRVRALRSWQVQDRYVNIGDVGGIVYDEKTLSQDGACWLFRGNFNFPGARIGGDSIVDIGEEVPDVNSPTPDLNILGSSAVVGSKVRFSVTATAADAITLIASDFEQGGVSYSAGTHWETWKAPSANNIRTKTPIFMGGKSVTLNVNVPDYKVQAFVMDRDGIGITATNTVNTGEGITVAVPAGQYFMVRLSKNPVAAIVPADATAAQIKFKGAYKNTLNIIDSRVSINSATDTVKRVSVILGGSYLYTIGGEFPPCNIVRSTFNITRDAGTSRSVYIVVDVCNSNVLADATTSDVNMLGVFSNVKNLVHSLPGGPMTVAGKNSIQVYDCDNMVVSLTNFPGLAAAQTANVPVKFYGCNLNAARIYHHAQIANTYRDINFDLATKDLGKAIASGQILASAEVEGMYRLYSTTGSVFGALVEAHDSVKSLNMAGGAATYGTTIYADAYLDGLFDLEGTNVFGSTKKHDTQNVSGCKIMNTKETAVNMKGNIRVEGNATLTNCSIFGSGYFGGNCVAYGLILNGCAFMDNNAVLEKTSEVGTVRRLYMRDNSRATISAVTVFGLLDLRDNAVFSPASYGVSEADIIMRDNATIKGRLSANGVLKMEGNAAVSGGTLMIAGDITLCGSYNQTTSKSWTGKRVIDSVDAPEYDNNVKTQYDF